MCENAHVANVGWLLGNRKIDMSCFNHHSRIPFLISALYGQCVENDWLLGHGDVDATTSDTDGDAALALADLQGHIGIGQLMLGHEETASHQDAITTSSVAISHRDGHQEIVEMLMLDWKMVPSSARTGITLFTDRLFFQSQSPAQNESENSSFRKFQILPRRSKRLRAI